MSIPAQGAVGAESMTDTLWCMHISGPDDVHAAPDFWTALAWAAELNSAVAARAIKQGWAKDDNWPLAQATVQPWPWSADRHADSLAAELAARSAKEVGTAGPVVIEAASSMPGDIFDWALTVQWPDGSETVEHCSTQVAALLGYVPEDDASDATLTPES